MATTVNICKKETVSTGLFPKVRFFYCDPANPGVVYVTAPCNDNSLARDAAIKAHINLRKDAMVDGEGIDYAGKPAPPPAQVTV